MPAVDHDSHEALCLTCAEGVPDPDRCPMSPRPCGHHCNHSWTQDECCWCGREFGEDPLHDPGVVEAIAARLREPRT